MSAIEGVLAVLGACGVLAAGAFEARLSRLGHPKRYLYAWLAWTPLATGFLWAVTSQGAGRPELAPAVALLGGPIVYPIVLVMMRVHLATHPTERKIAWEELQRMRYRPKDFGSAATETPAAEPEHKRDV